MPLSNSITQPCVLTPEAFERASVALFSTWGLANGWPAPPNDLGRLSTVSAQLLKSEWRDPPAFRFKRSCANTPGQVHPRAQPEVLHLRR